MQAEHRSTALLLAVLMVPFGVAVYQDVKADPNAYADALADYGSYGYEHDESNYAYDPAFDERLEELEAYNEEALQAELAQLERLRDIPDRMPFSFFDEVFFEGGKGKAPALSGPLSDIKLGMTSAALFEAHADASSWQYTGLPGYEHTEVSLYFSDDEHLRSLELRFPDDGGALRSMAAQWGPAEQGPGEDQHLWHNAELGLQAELVSSEWDDYAILAMSRFQELDELIGKGSRFGFEGDTDLLRLSRRELMAMPGYADDEIVRSLPRVRGGDGSPELVISCSDEGVDSVSLVLDLSPTKSAELLRLIEAKYGRAQKGGDEWLTSYTFTKGARTIKLESDDSGWNALTLRAK